MPNQPIRLLDLGCWYKFKYWLANSADPDQLASSEANWSGSTLFAQGILGFSSTRANIEGWAQDYGNSNIFLKPLFRGNLDPFVNNANLGAIAHTSNGT